MNVINLLEKQLILEDIERQLMKADKLDLPVTREVYLDMRTRINKEIDELKKFNDRAINKEQNI